MRIEGLSVDFGTARGRTTAVDDLSLDIREGQVFAVVGESGCGKSATAMAAMGLLPPTASVTGSARLGDTELVGLDEEALNQVRGREISMVFQEPMTSLNPVMRVGAQVSEVLLRHTDLSRRQARERVVELLEQVGIPEARHRAREYPHQLSGGMRQRVVIAMAVACAPRVIIADEPTTALDVTVQATILQILRDLASGARTGVLLITHDLGVVADIADEVAVMYAGRIVEQGPVGAIFARPTHPYTRALLAATPVPGAAGGRRLAEIPGLVPVLAEPACSCAFRERCSRAVERCGKERPELVADASGHPVSCFNPEREGRLDE